MAYKILLTKTPKSKNTALTTNKLQVTATEATYIKRLMSFHLNSNDTSAQVATVYYTDENGVEVVIGTLSVPAISTNINGVVDVMNSLYTFFKNIDGAGNRFFDIPIGAYFSVQMAAITSAKSINCTTTSALYDPD